MNLRQFVLIFVATLFSIFFLQACGGVKEAKVPSLSVTQVVPPIEVPRYPREELKGKKFTFSTNYLFLWKEKIRTEHVQAALDLIKRKNQFDGEQSTHQHESKKIALSTGTLETRLLDLEMQKFEFEMEYEGLSDSEKASQKGKKLKRQLDETQFEMANLNAVLEPYRKQEKELKEEFNRNIQDTISVLTRLQDNTDWYDPAPREFGFGFDEKEKLSVWIRAWDLQDGRGERDFNFENGLIYDASYIERGGRLRFTLRLSGDATLRFELDRTDKPLQGKGKFNMSGKIFLVRDGETERQGAAVFTLGL